MDSAKEEDLENAAKRVRAAKKAKAELAQKEFEEKEAKKRRRKFTTLVSDR